MHDSSPDSFPDVIVGIDVSKARLDVFVSSCPSKTFSVPNDASGLPRLIETLTAAEARLVVVEATGRYHRRLAADLLAVGIPVAVVNPARVREFAKALGQLSKTDSLDAKLLAAFGQAISPAPMEKPHTNQTILHDLVSRRTDLVRQRAAEITRFDDSLPKLAKAQNQKLQRFLSQQIEDLDREIAKLIENDDDWRGKAQLLSSVPGVGPATTANLMAGLPELGKLSRTAIARLVGVAPVNCDSGQSKGQRHVKGGRLPVRNALYMAAFSAMRFNARFKTYAERLKAAGKAHKVIVTACMRKLLTILNQMVKTNSPWNPNLPFQLQ